MKHLFLLLAIASLSACDGIIAALACSEDYSVEESDSCPWEEPYQCSEDGSCHARQEDADDHCWIIATGKESECESDSSSDDSTYDDSQNGVTEPADAGI